MKIIILITLLSINIFAGEVKKIKLPSITFPMAKDDNFKVMQRNCQWCHSYGYILNQGKQSYEFWNGVIVRMRDIYKAPITDKDAKIATEYLFKHYGKNLPKLSSDLSRI